MQAQAKIAQHASLKRYLLNPPTEQLRVEQMHSLENHIVVGDAIEVLSALPDHCVDLVHSSPPYNIDKPYELGVSDKGSIDDYRTFLERSIAQLKRVVRPGGSIFWQTGYTQSGGDSREIIPIDLLSYEFFRQDPNRFLLWDRIIWRYWGGHAFTKKFTNKHETIMWYVKQGAEPVFSADAVRERAKEYDKRNNFWGRNPGNVWEVDRVAFGTTEQTSHIAVFPEEISERIVRACSEPGNLVLDPFAGSGTVPKVAHGLGRRWLGIEISPAYADEAAIRVGYQQPSEADSLASELIKEMGFGGKRGTLPLIDLQRRLSVWVARTSVQQLWDCYQRDVDSVFKDANGRNLTKRDVWVKYDSLMNGQDLPHDPVQTADHLLLKCYRLRQHFNGVTRYKSALMALARVSENVIGDPAGTYLRIIAQQEPSSFKLTEGHLEFLSPKRNVVMGGKERGRTPFDALINDDNEPLQRRMLL